MVRASEVTDGMDAVASQYEALRERYAVREQANASYVVWKQGATYYADHCLGTGNDFSGANFATVVNSALTALTSGGKVLIKNGSYSYAEALEITSSHVSLCGEGKGTILTMTAPNIHGISVNGYDGLRLSDFQLIGTGAGTGDGIYCDSMDESVIERVHIEDFYDGIYMDTDCKKTTVVNSHLESCQNYGLYQAHYGDVDTTRVLGNGFFNNAVGGLYAGHYFTNIVGNTFYGTAGTGYGVRVVSQDFVITGNILDRVSQGVGVDSAGLAGVITGNIFSHCYSAGIFLNNIAGNVTISGNEFNHMEACHSLIIDADHIGVFGNTFYENPTGGGAFDDINFVDGDDCHISNNIFDTSGRYGVNIAAGCNRTTVLTNTFQTPGTAAILDAGASSVIRQNIGWVTENSGTGTITNPATSEVIAHGLSVTPTVDDISITMAENPTNAITALWVDTIGAANFTVNCEPAPGVSNLDFGWRVVVL